jgi:hypothetical protein
MRCIVRQITKKKNYLINYTKIWWLKIWKLDEKFKSLEAPGVGSCVTGVARLVGGTSRCLTPYLFTFL